jgi:hypothetical protein
LKDAKPAAQRSRIRIRFTLAGSASPPAGRPRLGP